MTDTSRRFAITVRARNPAGLSALAEAIRADAIPVGREALPAVNAWSDLDLEGME
jgi:hypothetical protein